MRLFGIKIGIHWSWWIFLFIFLFIDISTGGLNPIQSFIVLGMLTFSILGHEISHSLMARYFGYETRYIKLHLMGGVAMVSAPNPSPKETILISAAGPAFNLVSAHLGLCLFFINPYGAVFQIGAQEVEFSILGMSLIFYITMNLLMGLFNLIPAYPMDGGRILRAALYKNPVLARKVSVSVSLFFAFLMAALGYLTGNLFLLFIAIFICYVLFSESSGPVI